MLTGPGKIALLYTDDLYHVFVDITRGDTALRLASTVRPWDRIAPGQQTGIDAGVAILEALTVEANVLLGGLERFTAEREQAAYDRALDDSLDVTEGIDAHDVCGCGEPIALYAGSCPVYNDKLRGTDDHDPAPSRRPREKDDASDAPRTRWCP